MRLVMWTVPLATLVLGPQALAQVDPKCQGLEMPEGYDEQAQQDFLSNYFALASTFSAIHAPVPHEPGHGAIGVDVAVMPPLGCERRFVLQHTKTEDTNKSPVIPRPRVTYAFPAIGRMVPYAGVAYVPPVRLLGTTNVILSGEFGVGFQLGETFQLGGRFHATSQKTVAEIATPFVEGDPAYDDLYIASTFGLDLMAGADLDVITPYLALGWTDASTFLYIGDDSVVANNFHPYFGPTASLGLDGLVAERLRFGAEFYSAFGGYSRPDKEVESVKPASRYGSLYTGRIRLAVEL
jgi:hypothetical protein